jgi:hypothetical protein
MPTFLARGVVLLQQQLAWKACLGGLMGLAADGWLYWRGAGLQLVVQVQVLGGCSLL